MRKTVSALTDNDKTIARTTSILQLFTDEIKKKYNNVHTTPPGVEDYLDANVTVTLANDERMSLDQPLSFDEMTKAANNMHNGKSSGSNGFTACFFSDTSGI